MLHLYQLCKNFKQDLARESGHFLQDFAGILQNPARAFQDLARERSKRILLQENPVISCRNLQDSCRIVFAG